MAKQPIYGEDGTVIDDFDDGLPEVVPPVEERSALADVGPIPTEEPREEVVPQTQEQEVAHEDDAGEAAPPSYPWTVPTMLKGTSDLFLGLTVHADDGDPQGPRITLFVREVPGEKPIVKSFRAAELSQQDFLDDLQKAIAVTMQAYFLGWVGREQKRLAEEEKRKTRQQTTSHAKAAPTGNTPSTASSKTPQPPAKASQEVVKSPEPKKYAVVSMFDE